MPTIELISIKAPSVPELPKFKGFAYIAEVGTLSHRGLFQDQLDRETGIIVHLGNKALEGKEDGGWFAGRLMEWSGDESGNLSLMFESQRFPDVVALLKKMIEISPVNQVIFLTDYQFGPEERTIIHEPITISEFIDFHRQKKLKYNTLYWITEPISKE